MRWVLVVCGLAAACHVTPAEQAETDCVILCRCLTPLPTGQAECEKQCDAQLTASDACTECVEDDSARCDKVVGTCLDICLQQPNPPTNGAEVP